MSVPDLSIYSPFAHLDAYEHGLRPYDPPVPLYKYMERRWADEVLNSGCVQLSSITDYRDLKEDGETRDEDDGRQRTTMFDADLPLEIPSKYSEWITFAPDVIGNPLTNQLSAYNVWHNTGADSCFVLCLTPLLDAQLMKKLDPKYDCALQIDDPIGFFITLARLLVAKGTSHSPFLGQCSYDGLSTFTEKLSGRERVLPRALMKRWEHSHHQEVRMVFPTTGVPTKPLQVTAHELRAYVRLVSP